ncbi:hypothetical protein AAF712_015886 [Marasmius tenuissimus]|uniref:Taste receptor type 2 n=1 Tax=Marasmius tenuissimus TaxID=585030 RepID=A0ABR2Z8A9_9AGAR
MSNAPADFINAAAAAIYRSRFVVTPLPNMALIPDAGGMLAATFSEILLYGEIRSFRWLDGWGARALNASTSGFLVCNYLFTLYVMIKVSTVMFFVATLHFSIALYRGWIAFQRKTGEPAAIFFSHLDTWHRVLQDMLFVIQESLGAAAAIFTVTSSNFQIYRSWVLWNKNWKILSALLVIYTAELGKSISYSRFDPPLRHSRSRATGIGVCVTYTHKSTGGMQQAELFQLLDKWSRAHAAILICLNSITASLMAARVWKTRYTSSKYRQSTSRLDPILRILVESTMLQLIPEILLLIFLCLEMSAAFIFLQALAPIIAITFNTLTLRIKLYNLKDSIGFVPCPDGRTSRLGTHVLAIENDRNAQSIQISVGIHHNQRSHEQEALENLDAGQHHGK